jgi:hypothetical protein
MVEPAHQHKYTMGSNHNKSSQNKAHTYHGPDHGPSKRAFPQVSDAVCSFLSSPPPFYTTQIASSLLRTKFLLDPTSALPIRRQRAAAPSRHVASSCLASSKVNESMGGGREEEAASKVGYSSGDLPPSAPPHLQGQDPQQYQYGTFQPPPHHHAASGELARPPVGFPQPAPPPGFAGASGGGGHYHHHHQQQPYAPAEPYYAQGYQTGPGMAGLSHTDSCFACAALIRFGGEIWGIANRNWKFGGLHEPHSIAMLSISHVQLQIFDAFVLVDDSEA